MQFDVAVIADLCVDILIKGDVVPVWGQAEVFVEDYCLELGGSAGIFASQFARLGGKVGLYGKVGNDLFGHYLRDRITGLGIAADHVFTSERFRTPVGLGLIMKADRAMLTYRGCLQELSFEAVEASGLLAQAPHLHIAGYFLLEALRPHWPELLPRLRQQGMTVSLDTNWSPAGDWDAVREILGYVDVFAPNEEEALHISGTDNVEDALQWLSRLVKLTVIKRGARGAVASDRESGNRVDLPAESLDERSIADTTGAGDNFDAGFLYAWLKGAPLAHCVRLGVRCGTASLTRMGGIEGQLVGNAECN
ncbi:MAG TPA: carbohydrate kinase family protein [Steroidobacteraceae bacterium]|nr:carbohydrate kinase family protein [Steroidobacteraceae bacterium]